MLFIYFIVMTPVVIIMQSSPLLIIVNDSASLTCMGMGGPRLELTWDRDGTVVANATTTVVTVVTIVH